MQQNQVLSMHVGMTDHLSPVAKHCSREVTHNSLRGYPTTCVGGMKYTIQRRDTLNRPSIEFEFDSEWPFPFN